MVLAAGSCGGGCDWPNCCCYWICSFFTHVSPIAQARSHKGRRRSGTPNRKSNATTVQYTEQKNKNQPGKIQQKYYLSTRRRRRDPNKRLVKHTQDTPTPMAERACCQDGETAMFALLIRLPRRSESNAYHFCRRTYEPLKPFQLQDLMSRHRGAERKYTRRQKLYRGSLEL